MVLGGFVTLLVGAVGWQAKTVIANASRTTQLEAALEAKADKVDVLEHYVRRNDYVTQMTVIGAKMDGMAVGLARIEERLGGRSESTGT